MAVRVRDRIEANIRQSDKVNNNLSIQLNSGTAIVYNGSVSKSINVTPAAINAVNKNGDTNLGNMSWAAGAKNSVFPSHYFHNYYDSNNNVYFHAYPMMDISTGSASHLHFRVVNGNGSFDSFIINGGGAITWKSATILDSKNYTNYTVTKTGSGASGNWNINAATATALTTSAGNSTTPIYFSNGKPVAITMSNLTIAKPSITSVTFNDIATYGNCLGMADIVNPTDGTASYVNPNAQIGWHHFINMSYATQASNMWQTQLACRAGSTSLWIRSRNGGSINNSAAWSAPWVLILTSGNYSSYALPLTGGSLSGSLRINTSGKYYMIGCQNDSFAHHYTDASVGHWFNKDVCVQGNIFCGSNYSTLVLTTAGGAITGQISKAGQSCSWIDGRNGAGLRITSYTGYNPSVSMKTTNGSWEIGVYTNNNLWFTYASDANYNAGTNTVAQFHAAPNGTIYGAVWNDYAEFRSTTQAKAGEIVIENGDGTMHRSNKRLEPAANVVSDTYGFAIGETDEHKTPIAVAGRVLVYPYEDRYSYKAGDAVCSAPDGKVSKMSQQEMVMYPNCIIGYVSEIPEYEVWGQTDVPVDGRIWIKV